MHTYEITLTRWDPKRGERRVSSNTVTVEDFEGAVEIARHQARAAGEADPSRAYKVASVKLMGLSAVEAVHGWMTEEEFLAHVAKWGSV